MVMNTSISKRLMEGIQADLKSLASECKRKHPAVKQSADTCQLKLRIIVERSPSDLLPSLLDSSSDIIRPFILGCETNVPKVVQLCLNSIQRLTQFTAISPESGTTIINTLWKLMESSTEELKLLQTVLLLVNTNTVIQHDSLAKALVLSLRLHFSKDITIINTAAATVCQLINCVFERVSEEDIRHKNEDPQTPTSPNSLKMPSKHAPASLRPCAQDAYLLFQDLCQLVNASQPYWLNGIVEITRTFCLQLIETSITEFSHVFLKHKEFCFILKEKVCTIVIRLFSSGIKHGGGAGSGVLLSGVGGNLDRNFPITVRLLRIVNILIQNYYELLITESEIFLSLLVKFLDTERPLWQRTLVLEVICKLCSQPSILRKFCESYDMKEQSTAIFQDIINGLSDFLQSQFIKPTSASSIGSSSSANGSSASNSGHHHPSGVNASHTYSFVYHNTSIPLVINISLPMGSQKTIFLEMCEKLDTPNVADGYAFSLAFLSMLNIVHCIVSLVTEQRVKADRSLVGSNDVPTAMTGDGETVKPCKVLTEQLITSSWCALMAALSLLLDASCDDMATEAILNSIQSFTGVCGLVDMEIPRDAFISILCKASLPPHYNFISNGGQSKPENSELIPASQVVAVGTPLATSSGVQSVQGSVMLTCKNIQCMKALLTLTINHGSILGSSWCQILNTLQHLVWILGVKTSPINRSSSQSTQSNQETATSTTPVITTAIQTDLPTINNLMINLFDNSKHLDEATFDHMMTALFKLSEESMSLAYTNRDISLFAVAKLLETTLVNLHRVNFYWSRITDHLLVICLHPNVELRSCASTSLTTAVKIALSYNYKSPLKDNKDLQLLLLSPIEVLSKSRFIDIRPKLLECIFQILHSNSDSLRFGWPLLLEAIGEINDEQSESMIRSAFQSLQLVVTDFLPIMPSECLFSLVTVASRFGLQARELNISLTSIGLLWNVSDYFSQNGEHISKGMAKYDKELTIDKLWMRVFKCLGDLCVDQRPAVRKSAGHTLFSMITTHGALLQSKTWTDVLWQVLFPLLDNVEKQSREASDTRSLGSDSTENILIHHSRDNPQKQWAETRVLTLAGVARVFYSRRADLIVLDNFAKAWTMLLQFIQLTALSKNPEVSLSALKSFQEILSPPSEEKDNKTTSLNSSVKTSSNKAVPFPTANLEAKASRTATTSQPKSDSSTVTSPGPLAPLVAADGGASPQFIANTCISDDPSRDATLWSAAWKVWLHIGSVVTTTPGGEQIQQFVPSQPFLTALMSIFPSMYYQVKTRFTHDDLQKLSVVLQRSLCVPVHTDNSPYIMPVAGELTLTQLQVTILAAVKVIHKEVIIAAPHIQNMYTDVFSLLLSYVKYAVCPPKFGHIDAKPINSKSHNQANWVAMNYVPFTEAIIVMIVELYVKTASHRAVIKGQVLQQIVKEFRIPLKAKYSCPCQSTWLLVVNSLMTCLNVGLPIARLNDNEFIKLWPDLADLMDDFLFPSSKSPENQSNDECQRDENMDLQFTTLIREQLLPYSKHLTEAFIVRLVDILNKGSMHSTTGIQGFIADVESSRKLREQFSRCCFETLLQFSFIMKSNADQNGTITKLAITSFMSRCKQVISQFISDEQLSGDCPLPRPRLTEMIFVLKAVDILVLTLKHAPKSNVDKTMWKDVISLYPLLVNCINTSSQSIIKPIGTLLHQYADLLAPP